MTTHDSTIVALLTDSGCGRLRSLLSPAVSCSLHTALERAVAEIHAPSAKVLVLDPTPFAPTAMDRLSQAVALRGVPVVVYMPPSRAATGRVLSFVGNWLPEVVVWGADDERVAVWRAVRHAPLGSAPARVLQRLAQHLVAVPEPEAAAALALFASVPIPTSTRQFINACGATRRTAERHFARAGIHSPECLVNGARLARTWEPDRPAKVGAVLIESGYRSYRTLSAHYTAFIGMPRGIARGSLAVAGFADRIAAHILSARPRAKRSAFVSAKSEPGLGEAHAEEP